MSRRDVSAQCPECRGNDAFSRHRPLGSAVSAGDYPQGYPPGRLGVPRAV